MLNVCTIKLGRSIQLTCYPEHQPCTWSWYSPRIKCQQHVFERLLLYHIYRQCIPAYESCNTSCQLLVNLSVAVLFVCSSKHIWARCDIGLWLCPFWYRRYEAADNILPDYRSAFDFLLIYSLPEWCTIWNASLIHSSSKFFIVFWHHRLKFDGMDSLVSIVTHPLMLCRSADWSDRSVYVVM